MKLLKGKKVADKILKDIERNIKRENLKPALAVILIGNDEASEIYVRLKEKAAKKVGISFRIIRFSEREKEKNIIQEISMLNKSRKFSGIIIQLPLPKKLNTQRIINSLNPRKDVDGFHPISTRSFINKKEAYWPVFPHAIWRMIEGSGKNIKGKKAMIIANSKKFGEVMKAVLKNKKVASEYVLGSNIKKFQGKIKAADIIISACGHPGMIKGEMIKKGSIIVDGGIRKKGKKVLGDVDFDSVKKIAGFLTPVPGGVGPVTIACLLENVYLAAKKQSK